MDLKELQSVRCLSLSHNKLINVIGVTQLSNLLELNLNHNQLVDVSPLSQCKM